MIDFMFGLKKDSVIVYDIETYDYCFTFYGINVDTFDTYYFEISKFRDDQDRFMSFIDTCKRLNSTWVGFNNIAFDYPVVHWMYKNRQERLTSHSIHAYGSHIIKSDPFSYMIWDDDRIVPQIDLFKVHHFDNKARSTSLKVLEFNMRMQSIEDLPFAFDRDLTEDEILRLKSYNAHDVKATLEFFNESKDKLRFRAELTEKYGKNFMNHNDTKIGKDYFIMELENQGIKCFEYVDGKRKPRQTVRSEIDLSDVILPTISFSNPEFNRILTWLKSQTIKDTKGVFKDVNCTINDFQFDFGTGGIHGSIESSIVRSTDEYVIIDIDVASYYPNLAIANNFYPEHLGREFCSIYNDVYQQRKQYAKGTAENAMLKLALNGVYGDSNNQYSPFYDPKYTMCITINGQLLLCMLAEVLMGHGELMLIQINTDGLTVKIPKKDVQWLSDVCRWWESFTGLVLEEAEYSHMYIRDVNNYIAVYTDGNVKRKGAYEYEREWHQNQSNLIVPMAAEANLLHGVDIEDFITSHGDYFDFMMRAKVPRSSKLMWGDEQVQNTTRYYISNTGKPLTKVMPATGPIGQYKKSQKASEAEYEQWHNQYGNVYNPDIHTKNRSVHEDRHIGINTGWMVTVCNKLEKGPADINYAWYVAEAEKLCKLELNLEV